MDSEGPRSSTSLASSCDDYECTPSMSQADSEAWLCSIKMKIENFEREKQLTIPVSEIPHVAHVEIGNECDALREMVTCQQKTIQNLSLELEEERSASSSAANEMMSMMLRLQKEKAEIQLEFRQFKRYAEEKMAHDQHEISVMEDLLYKREMVIESLYDELQACRCKMKSYGLAEFEVDGDEGGAMPVDDNADAFFDAFRETEALNYPPLRCSLSENLASAEVDDDVMDIDKYAFGDTPQGWDQLKEFPGSDNAWEKVIVDQSFHQPTHIRKISTDSPKSFVMTVRETGSDLESPRFVNSQIRELRKGNNGSEIGDDTSDKVCTIISESKPCYDLVSSPRGVSLNGGELEDPYIKKLYMRLQALEADRESMRKTLNAMQTDKAQVVLLKEIAQHLCKEMPPAKRKPEKKSALIRSFSFLSVFTWLLSFIFWRTKPCRTKYMFGMSARNVGLLMFVDKGPRVGQWRCLLSTQI